MVCSIQVKQSQSAAIVHVDWTLISMIGNTCVYPTILYQYGCPEKGVFVKIFHIY